MNNVNKKSYTTKRAVMFFLYVFVGVLTTILALYHFASGSINKGLIDEVIMSAVCGLAIAALCTYIRIKSGRMSEPIVHMRKFKYWAFTELTLLYFFMMIGIVHLFDNDAAFLMQEIIFAVFFGLFCAGVNVLYLIKREKGNRD